MGYEMLKLTLTLYVVGVRLGCGTVNMSAALL